MTFPGVPQQAPPCDAGNTLLGEVPSTFTTSLVDTPAGQRLLLTVRTASTTLTVLLNGPDAKAWAANFSAQASKMSSSGLIAANGHIPEVPGNGAHPN